jgi:aspartokinase
VQSTALFQNSELTVTALTVSAEQTNGFTGWTNEKNIYLSFDDGPHPDVTPFVLDELKKYLHGIALTGDASNALEDHVLSYGERLSAIFLNNPNSPFFHRDPGP